MTIGDKVEGTRQVPLTPYVEPLLSAQPPVVSTPGFRGTNLGAYGFRLLPVDDEREQAEFEAVAGTVDNASTR